LSKTRHKEDGNAELAWYRKAIEASGDVVYDWDLATDRMRWSGVAEKLFGAGPDGVPGSGDTFQRQINPEDLPQRTKTLADHFAGIIRYDCEYRVRGENGEFQWVHVLMKQGRHKNEAAGPGTGKRIEEENRCRG